MAPQGLATGRRRVWSGTSAFGLNRAFPGRLRGAAWLEAAVVLVGAVVLLGWLARVGFLTSFSTEASMKPNTALSFMLAGAALWILHEHRERRGASVAAWLLACAVTLIGLLTLTEYAFGWNLHVDQLLFHDASGSSPPGRMGQVTAIAFALVGLSLLLLDVELWGFRPAQAGALAAGVIALVVLAGFLYGGPSEEGGFSAAVGRTAPHTSLTFLVLTTAVLLARPRCGVMALVQGSGTGAAALRRLLVPVVAIPLVVGWLRLEGERAGFYGVELGLALMVVSAAVLSVAVVYIITRSLERTDAERAQAQKAQAEALRESKHAQRDVEQSFQLLHRSDAARRLLLEKLVRAQEEERRRIAADIHDDSVQVMTAMTLRLDLLRKRLPDDLVEEVEVIEQTARSSIHRLRRLVFELRPPALDRDGLAAALRQYLDEQEDDPAIEYSLDVDLKSEPDPGTRAIVYRIAQEALTNVAKHAHATRVGVELETTETGIRARITDDGRGFTPGAGDSGEPGHVGLDAMCERAEMAGGWLRIESEPGAGTTVEFELPDGLSRR